MFGAAVFTSPLAIKCYCILAAITSVIVALAIIVHSIRADAVKDLKADDAKTTAAATAQAAKIDTAQAAVDAKSVADNSNHQEAIASVAKVIKQKVSSHVHDPAPTAPRVVGCITYGFVREHDAAVQGVDPDTLPLPSGATDDACSPVAASALARAIADNYEAARANAAQLNDLIANVNGKVDATTPKQ